MASGGSAVWNISPASRLQGVVRVPGDKSISHRALLFSALSSGVQEVRGLSLGEDVRATAGALRSLGVPVDPLGDSCSVGAPPSGRLTAPGQALDCGNSGTTLRLLSGVLAGQPFESVLTGDASLRRRPMARVVHPLRAMGAKVEAADGDNLAPLTVQGGALRGIVHRSPIASAQVKSCLLLAGLFAEGCLEVHEPHRSRDHTERMFQAFGVDLEILPDGVRMLCGQRLQAGGGAVIVPADLSGAAFFLVGAAILPGSELVLPGVGVNPTRTGLLDVLSCSLDSRPAGPLGEEAADLHPASVYR